MRLVKAVLAASIGAAIALSSSVQAKQITIGFSQIGAESEWRTANTNDVKRAAKENGINLKFSDAQQKQENQIKAIRTFIAQKVDLIGFVPIVATGWDNILREAKRAKIPVLIMDRDLTVSDPSLYVAKIGTDMYTEGRKVFDWLDEYVTKNNIKPRNGGDKINIVILEGTVGASATTGRGNGFNDAMNDSDNKDKYKILASQTGDFTRQKGQEVMESFLKSNRNDIDVLFAMNDDMALGAIQAIEAAGLKPSKDIIIVSVDGVKGIFQAMMDGKANATVECNPLQGDLFFKTAQKILKGESVPKSVFVEEGVYTSDNAAEVFPTRQY
ncbi:MAG: ABC transporter substrate-binding protein [Succinivibrio sp.]|mgnify:FL=1|uniref:ABC transporter substrate-binding protein n=1 Tax=Succinivibrio faecicola TaxID=2820300 RepID=A0ABS7DG93_9GAMM|nr:MULTISPECIES: ABC transporter substrate-binding protein [Succinivibrio]MBW7570315.1 ABC transporter substrate-binding protein [Succinivibrio faecicola]MCI6939432.1 ABC transporter substrate-binding protein [Succinatimonas hippei]MDD6205306.1 ABC transporter substrate-binding protein [Succinivibrio sp.]